jgi:hypothetical protein
MRTGQVKARKLSPIVPVMIYKNLSDDDLKAIFAFLRTVKPVKHRLDNTEPPIECSCASRNTARGMRTSSIPSGVTVRREHKERRRPGGCPGGRPRLPIESKGFHRKQQQGAGI